jgi:hypothetical protein
MHVSYDNPDLAIKFDLEYDVELVIKERYDASHKPFRPAIGDFVYVQQPAQGVPSFLQDSPQVWRASHRVFQAHQAYPNELSSCAAAQVEDSPNDLRRIPRTISKQTQTHGAL